MMMVNGSTLRLETINALASYHSVPVVDLLMIAVNMHGVNAEGDIPRARIRLAPEGSPEIWQIILPLDSPRSPFEIRNGNLLLQGETVARIEALENDDVVLTYLRAGGRSVTLNTNSRSNCIGCIFCPNIIEDAADATVKGSDALEGVLSWLCTDMDWRDLGHVEVITVCSGCFHTPDAAIEHMAALRVAASRLGFSGRLHLLSSVVRNRVDIARLADRAGPFHLTYTLECFERRDVLLKSTKASLTVDETCRALDDCAEFGVLGDFTYVAGLDTLGAAIDGLTILAEHVTTFPRIQVYQAHNDLMRRYRSADAADLNYYIDLRRSIEPAFVTRGLAPRSWENYRPLWYERFAGEAMTGPRI